MQINYEDVKKYLSEDEIKNIVESELRNIVREGLLLDKEPKRIIDNYERVIGNSIYYYLENEIDKILGTDSKQLIKDKVKETLLTDNYSYSIFREKSHWNVDDSIGRKVLKDAVNDNKDIIRAKVSESISKLSYDDFHEMIIETMQHIIETKLTKEQK